MSKKRCKLSAQDYADKICKTENFVCQKCNRVAKKGKKLCKPTKKSQ